MRTTIDSAGRVVIPKSVRDAAGLASGAEIEIEFREGSIEITPATVPMHLVAVPGGVVVEAEAAMEPLSAADVRDALDRTRR